MASLFDDKESLLETHQGSSHSYESIPSSEEIGEVFEVACRLRAEAKFAIINFVKLDWTPLPVAWEKDGEYISKPLDVKIDLVELVKLQSVKAKQEAEQRAIAKMDLRDWTDKRGKLICRAEFFSFKGGTLSLRTDELTYKDVKLSELSKVSAKQLRQIIKDRRGKKAKKMTTPSWVSASLHPCVLFTNLELSLLIRGRRSIQITKTGKSRRPINPKGDPAPLNESTP